MKLSHKISSIQSITKVIVVLLSSLAMSINSRVAAKAVWSPRASSRNRSTTDPPLATNSLSTKPTSSSVDGISIHDVADVIYLGRDFTKQERLVYDKAEQDAGSYRRERTLDIRAAGGWWTQNRISTLLRIYREWSVASFIIRQSQLMDIIDKEAATITVVSNEGASTILTRASKKKTKEVVMFIEELFENHFTPNIDTITVFSNQKNPIIFHHPYEEEIVVDNDKAAVGNHEAAVDNDKAAVEVAIKVEDEGQRGTDTSNESDADKECPIREIIDISSGSDDSVEDSVGNQEFAGGGLIVPTTGVAVDKSIIDLTNSDEESEEESDLEDLFLATQQDEKKGGDSGVAVAKGSEDADTSSAVDSNNSSQSEEESDLEELFMATQEQNW